MGTLIKYELKKIITKRMNIIALILTLGLLLMFFRVEYKFTDSDRVNFDGKTYSEVEKNYWLGKISNINKPVKYEFFYGWSNIFNTYRT